MSNEAKQLNIISMLKDLYHHFTIHRKFQLFYLILLMIVTTFTEVVTIGAVLPFIAILTNPDKLLLHPYLKEFKVYFSIQNVNDLILSITVLFVLIVIISAFLRIVLAWCTSRITAAIGSELSVEVFRKVLYQPYYTHITQNSSEVINALTHKVDSVVFGVIFPSVSFINSFFIVLAISISLLIIQPIATLLSMIVFGISYFLIARMVRKQLELNSRCADENKSKSIKILQESLGGVRDMILDSNQEVYIKLYKETDIPLRKSGAINNFIGVFPKHTLETIALIVIAILAFYLTQVYSGIQKVLPILGAIAIGSQRLLPSVQQLYNGWVGIKSTSKQLFDVLHYLNIVIPNNKVLSNSLSFDGSFEIRNLSFQYNEKNPFIFNNLNLLITKGSRVGFIGTTGSGKSTLLDVIMGLLKPTSGEILVDGLLLNDNSLYLWQSKIAHVPQTIFLADASIAENIAFGIPKAHIDYDRVKFVSNIACVSEFVESYPNTYDTMVGERGINLSGGQRQRIGIARALYKNAAVLIFDEATSALDNHTEKKVMDSIENLDRNLTILIIAHRLSSLQDCDYILEVVNGKLVRRSTHQTVS